MLLWCNGQGWIKSTCESGESTWGYQKPWKTCCTKLKNYNLLPPKKIPHETTRCRPIFNLPPHVAPNVASPTANADWSLAPNMKPGLVLRQPGRKSLPGS